MADYNSSLPIRTENNGDAAVKVVDGTITGQALSIDASGRVIVKLTDGSGNSVTSQASGGQRALDVGINVAGVQVDPRSIRALTASDVVTAEQGTSPWVTQDAADGPVTPGAVAGKSILIGGQYNTSLPTLTNGQQAAIQVDSSGRLLTSVVLSNDTDYGTVGANTLRTASQIGNATGAAAFGAGTTGAQVLRVVLPTDQTAIPASQSGTWSVRAQDGSGNALTSSAAGGTRPLDVAMRDGSGNLYSSTNPLPVSVSSDPIGTEVNDYNTASAVAAGGTSNHTYTVTAGKTLLLNQIEASGSGKMKIEVQTETGVGTGSYNTKFVQFNSTSSPNMSIHIDAPISVAAGVRVRIIRTNRDNQAQDLYSTITGIEV